MESKYQALDRQHQALDGIGGVSNLQGVQLDTDSGSNSQMDKGGVHICKLANWDLTRQD